MHAAKCGSLALALNNNPTNQTEFTISTKRSKNLRIKCQCADNKKQSVRWFFNSDIEVPSQDENKSKQIYAREKDSSNILWILSDASPLEYVGVYRCTSTSNKASINIVVTGELIACY